MKSKSSSKGKITVQQIVVWFFAIIAIAICLSISVWFSESRPMTGKENEYTIHFVVPTGMTARQAGLDLEHKKIIRSANAFYLAARFHLFSLTESFNLKSGVYTLKSSMTMNQVYKVLQNGLQEYITVKIPEGLTISKIAALLEESGVCSKEEFITACKSKELLAEYAVPAENFEGYLFPDTYFLSPMMNGESVVRKMLENFKLKISNVDSLKKMTPQKLHDTIILASIVEREYRIESEAPLIASVFTNRIKKHIGLYSCATVEYVITEIQGKPHPERITYDDLKIDNPYNTYKWSGLPPGPISNPGLVAIKAAAEPARTDYYYFVLTDKEKGSHTFTKDFNTHIAAENGYYTKQAAGKK